MARHVDHDFDYPRNFGGHYNQYQPRVPRGHPDGGQWTSGGYRPLSELAELPAPDLRGNDEGRPLQTQVALLRQKSQIPGTRTNPPATAPDRPPGPTHPDWDSALGGLIIGKILRDLFGSGETATEPVVAFKARLHRWDGEKYVWMADRLLDEKEAKEFCPELGPVRDMLEKAIKAAGPPGNNKGAYGSKVHALVKEAIQIYNEDMRQEGTPEKQLGVPEKSIQKDGTFVERFEKGTIRPDLNNKEGKRAWCVLEHKVSVAATVSDKRMDEIAIRFSKAKIGAPEETPEWLVIIETKPWHPPELRNLQRGSQRGETLNLTIPLHIPRYAAVPVSAR